MNDPQEMGLDELGQRVQAMGDPANEPRRYYRGAPLPIGPATGGRLISPASDVFENPRATPSQEPHVPMHVEEHVSEPYQVPLPPPIPIAAVPFTAPVNTPPNGAVNPTAPTAPAAAPESAPANPAPAPSAPAPAPQPQLTSGVQDDPDGPKSGLQRIVTAVRTALPFVQKLLPLLDGNFASAVTALLAPTAMQQHNPPPPPVKVNLEPVERGIAELRSGQREIRVQIQDQVTAMKRVEDQLERVREATDRNTLEQQEMVEDLRAVGTRVSNLAIGGIILLAVSLGLNIYLVIQLQHILR